MFKFFSFLFGIRKRHEEQKFSLKGLTFGDVIFYNDWEYQLSMSPLFEDDYTVYTGEPMNNLKWTKVKNVLGEYWFGKKYKEYWKGDCSRLMEIAIGDIPTTHILQDGEY